MSTLSLVQAHISGSLTGRTSCSTQNLQPSRQFTTTNWKFLFSLLLAQALGRLPWTHCSMQGASLTGLNSKSYTWPSKPWPQFSFSSLISVWSQGREALVCCFPEASWPESNPRKFLEEAPGWRVPAPVPRETYVDPRPADFQKLVSSWTRAAALLE